MSRDRAAWRVRMWLACAVASLACSAAATRPADSPIRRVQTGLASYYGPGFHGERTASGEIFDQNEMVAAHRTLPFGTVVRVTNLENSRRVHVTITDRGPYKGLRQGRIIDLSKGAARRLRFLRDGLARVRVDVLRLPPNYDPSRGGSR